MRGKFTTPTSILAASLFAASRLFEAFAVDANRRRGLATRHPIGALLLAGFFVSAAMAFPANAGEGMPRIPIIGSPELAKTPDWYKSPHFVDSPRLSERPEWYESAPFVGPPRLYETPDWYESAPFVGSPRLYQGPHWYNRRGVPVVASPPAVYPYYGKKRRPLHLLKLHDPHNLYYKVRRDFMV